MSIDDGILVEILKSNILVEAHVIDMEGDHIDLFSNTVNTIERDTDSAITMIFCINMQVVNIPITSDIRDTNNPGLMIVQVIVNGITFQKEEIFITILRIFDCVEILDRLNHTLAIKIARDTKFFQFGIFGLHVIVNRLIDVIKKFLIFFLLTLFLFSFDLQTFVLFPEIIRMIGNDFIQIVCTEKSLEFIGKIHFKQAIFNFNIFTIFGDNHALQIPLSIFDDDSIAFLRSVLFNFIEIVMDCLCTSKPQKSPRSFSYMDTRDSFVCCDETITPKHLEKFPIFLLKRIIRERCGTSICFVVTLMNTHDDGCNDPDDNQCANCDKNVFQ